MSEKRFTFDYEYEFEIYDKQTKKHYDGTVGCQEKLVELLNEQQATISALKEENEQLQQKLKDIYSFKGSNCRCVKYE